MNTIKSIKLSKAQIDDTVYWLEYALDDQTDYDNRAELIAILAAIKNQTKDTHNDS